MDWEPHDRHWIRLRGPWQVVWVNDDESPGEEQRVQQPVDWRTLFGEQTGTARFSRRFQKPTRLEPREQVVITVTNPSAVVRCSLNDVPIEPLAELRGDPTCWPATDCCSFDITRHLRATNQLTLDVIVAHPSSGPVGLHEPVLLEIIDLDAVDG